MTFISTANARRPQDFKDLEGQNFVVSTIKNAIENKHFAHAYLFAGPRGVGKTTSARLLAKALNCEKGPTATPCGECPSCRGLTASSSIDCIEIDGASNTSVDDIRKIKNDIMYPPSSRYKIYIIDEVHMLSTSAFNALLKTIEEPPEYVIFIFATTEIQKVPQTIKSRCQFFKFRALESKTIVKIIENACRDNKVKIGRESLLWIAKRSGGSARDAYTIYDQLVSFCGNDITFEKIQRELLLTSSEKIEKIFIAGINGDLEVCMKEWTELAEQGVAAEQFIEDFASYLRAVLLYKGGVKAEDILFYPAEAFDVNEIRNLSTDKVEIVLKELLDLYRDIRYSVNPRFEIELFVSHLSEIKNRSSNIHIAKRLKELYDQIAGNTGTEKPSPVIPSVQSVKAQASDQIRKQPEQTSPPTSQKQPAQADKRTESEEDMIKDVFSDYIDI